MGMLRICNAESTGELPGAGPAAHPIDAEGAKEAPDPAL
jgi:hypothetical protein